MGKAIEFLHVPLMKGSLGVSILLGLNESTGMATGNLLTRAAHSDRAFLAKVIRHQCFPVHRENSPRGEELEEDLTEERVSDCRIES